MATKKLSKNQGKIFAVRNYQTPNKISFYSL